MASKSSKIEAHDDSKNQLRLIYAEDEITKYWSSSLFNAVYLRHDVSEKHPSWNDEDNIDFQNFMNTMRNLAAEYKGREKELQNWSETETINNWVKHVLHALGWTNNCEGVQNPFLEETSFRFGSKTYRTDILIVDHPKEKQYINQAKGDDKLTEARQTVLMPIEVKYWDRLDQFRLGKNEDRNRVDCESDDMSRTVTPNEQIVRYMDILKKNWGILTDGARWRLFNFDLSSEDPERCYEFNLISLFNAMTTEETEADSKEIIEASKYFYHFFSKFAFFPRADGEQPFSDEILKYSKKYVSRVEEDLKLRFVKAMNIACNGYNKAAQTFGASRDLSIMRNISESTLFNVLFIRSLESRSVLPMASTDYKKISLSSIIDKIERFDPEKDDVLNFRELERSFKKGNGNSFNYTNEGFELHERIMRLTGVIHKGASSKDKFGFEIAGFRESIFSEDEWKLVKSCRLTNSDWVKILFELGYAKSDSLNRKFQQIPYAYFTPRQLGSIYESFLEFKLEKAPSDMVFEKKQWKEVDLNLKKYRFSDLPTAKKGQLFFTPDNEERKATGSYYTPDYIVRFMVSETIGKYVSHMDCEEIQNIKVVDPAMGSGHFLVAALNFVHKAYIEKCTEASLRELNKSELRRRLLKNCIFGIDLNPRAVKLAKMSLWLETAAFGVQLENLDPHIINDNSLTSQKYWESAPNIHDRGFDVILANPPYGAEISREDKVVIAQRYKEYGSVSNSAAIFIYLIDKFLKKGGRAGFIVPKSICFSSGWHGAASFVSKRLEALIDCGKAFDDVLLEQVIFISGDSSTKSYLTGIAEANNINISGPVDLSLFKEHEILLAGVNRKELKIIEKILDRCEHKYADFVEIDRGLNWQAKSKKFSGKTPIYRGAHLSQYFLSVADEFIDLSKFKKEEYLYQDRPKVLNQLALAHVKNPYPHFKIQAALGKANDFVFETISCTFAKDKRYSVEFLLGLNNSKLFAWLLYKFVYSSAIRSTRFDAQYAGKIPLPEYDGKIVKKVESVVSEINDMTKTYSRQSKALKGSVEDKINLAMAKIDRTIFDWYELNESDISVIHPDLKQKKAAA
jgi:type I restriction-modification system DNA methylase subunit